MHGRRIRQDGGGATPPGSRAATDGAKPEFMSYQGAIPNPALPPFST
ncbi:hypothetical protein [Massilia orientalis]